MDELARRRVVVARSRPGYRQGMEHVDQPELLLEVEGSNWSRENSENRWDELSMDEGCHRDCSCRSNWQSLPHVVSHAPFRPSCDLAALQPREQQDRRHRPQQPFLQQIVHDSCFGFDCGGGQTRRTSRVGVGRGIGFSSLGRCRLDHHRTLLEQVHWLYFHAYYGYVRSGGRALTLILTSTLTSIAIAP